MNSKLFAVIRREYLQQVRTKAFWIVTFLIPSLFLVFIFVQVALNRTLVARGRIGVVDLSGRLFDGIVAEYKARPGDEDETKSADAKRKEKLSDAEILEKAGQAQKPKLATQLDLFKVDATPETLPAVRKRLNEDVQKERIKAYIVLTPQTLETGAAEWRAQSVKAEVVMRQQIASYISRAATKERLRDRGVDPRRTRRRRSRAARAAGISA
jgi:ABC-type Na+ efflux pump permease subunit